MELKSKIRRTMEYGAWTMDYVPFPPPPPPPTTPVPPSPGETGRNQTGSSLGPGLPHPPPWFPPKPSSILTQAGPAQDPCAHAQAYSRAYLDLIFGTLHSFTTEIVKLIIFMFTHEQIKYFDGTRGKS